MLTPGRNRAGGGIEERYQAILKDCCRSARVTAVRRPGSPGNQDAVRASVSPDAVSSVGRQQVQAHHLEPEAGDPLHESPQSRLVRQLGAQGGGARAQGHRAVVKCRA